MKKLVRQIRCNNSPFPFGDVLRDRGLATWLTDRPTGRCKVRTSRRRVDRCTTNCTARLVYGVESHRWDAFLEYNRFLIGFLLLFRSPPHNTTATHPYPKCMQWWSDVVDGCRANVRGRNSKSASSASENIIIIYDWSFTIMLVNK